MGNLIYTLLVQLSLFALGATIVAVYALLRARPPYWGAYVAVKAGTFVIIGTILFVVFPLHTVPVSGRALWYIGGLVLSACGTLGVARDVMRKAVRRSLPFLHDDVEP